MLAAIPITPCATGAKVRHTSFPLFKPFAQMLCCIPENNWGSVMSVLSVSVAFIMGIASLIHFYWALGGKTGLQDAGPTLEGDTAFTPGRFITFIVACLIMLLALLALLLHWSWQPVQILVPYAGCLVATVLVIRAVGDFRYVGFFKKVYNSRFARLDTRVFSPLILLLGIAYAILAARSLSMG